MISVSLIDHIVLRTQNTQSMVRFYSNVLACEVERTTPQSTGLIQLRAGQSLIDIVDVNSELGRNGGGAPTKSENNLDHFCLRIKKIAANELLQWLKQHGIDSTNPEIRYGAEGFGPSVYINDPDGNTIELRCEL